MHFSTTHVKKPGYVLVSYLVKLLTIRTATWDPTSPVLPPAIKANSTALCYPSRLKGENPQIPTSVIQASVIIESKPIVKQNFDKLINTRKDQCCCLMAGDSRRCANSNASGNEMNGNCFEIPSGSKRF